MEDVVVRFAEKPTLKSPILVEGLPGVGNVGKLAADYLKDKLKATPFATLHSKLLPPQVYVNEEGIIRLVSHELSYWRGKGSSQRDLIILTGDYQGSTYEGQYELTDKVLDISAKMGAKECFTLAGFAQGHLVQTPRVLGAATSMERVETMKKLGVVFSRKDPGGGLLGASGLFLGLGKLYGMESVCLMGETSGYFVDPRSAEAVLKVLGKALHVDIDLTALEGKAQEIDQIAQRFREMEARPAPSAEAKEDLTYIG
jgi:uncharacterized protein